MKQIKLQTLVPVELKCLELFVMWIYLVAHCLRWARLLASIVAIKYLTTASDGWA